MPLAISWGWSWYDYWCCSGSTSMSIFPNLFEGQLHKNIMNFHRFQTNTVNIKICTKIQSASFIMPLNYHISVMFQNLWLQQSCCFHMSNTPSVYPCDFFLSTLGIIWEMVKVHGILVWFTLHLSRNSILWYLVVWGNVFCHRKYLGSTFSVGKAGQSRRPRCHTMQSLQKICGPFRMICFKKLYSWRVKSIWLLFEIYNSWYNVRHAHDLQLPTPSLKPVLHRLQEASKEVITFRGQIPWLHHLPVGDNNISPSLQLKWLILGIFIHSQGKF